MEFGRLEDVGGVDFRLPADDAENARVLRGSRGGSRPRIHIGLAGWSDPGFAGRLHPPGTPRREFLARYARVLPTNELNSTYYGVSPERIARWRAAVPEGFRFCPKLPATITHERELAGAEAETEAFLAALADFGERMGLAWGTLGPRFGPERMEVLERYVSAYAPRLPLALELRHPRWFSDAGAREAVFACFEYHGVVAVLTDVAGRRDVLHMRCTTPATMLRFVGNAPHPSDRERLDAWAERLAAWRAAGLTDAWVFLHQKHDPDAIELARHLARRLHERTGVDPLPELTALSIQKPAVQGELF